MKFHQDEFEIINGRMHMNGRSLPLMFRTDDQVQKDNEQLAAFQQQIELKARIENLRSFCCSFNKIGIDTDYANQRGQNFRKSYKLLSEVNGVDLNSYNTCTGQTLIHQIAPQADRKLIAALVKKGLDPYAQTINPDPYPGSTIAHIIAGSLCKRLVYRSYKPKRLDDEKEEKGLGKREATLKRTLIFLGKNYGKGMLLQENFYNKSPLEMLPHKIQNDILSSMRRTEDSTAD